MATATEKAMEGAAMATATEKAMEGAAMATATRKVKVRLPRAEQSGEKTLFVGVNGKGYRIERGKEVEVPIAVAEVLRNAELAEDVVIQHVEANERREPT